MWHEEVTTNKKIVNVLFTDLLNIHKKIIIGQAVSEQFYYGLFIQHDKSHDMFEYLYDIHYISYIVSRYNLNEHGALPAKRKPLCFSHTTEFLVRASVNTHD